MISDKEFAEAEERGRLHTLAVPSAIAARYDAGSGMISIDLNRGVTLSFHKSRSQILHNASDEQLSEIEIPYGGGAVLFPKLDEGLTIEGILAGRFGNWHWERQWAKEHGIEIAEDASPQQPVAA